MSRYQSSAGFDPSPLGKPLLLPFSGREASNRFLKAAMTERIAMWPDRDRSARGIPGDELFSLYRTWGAGGFGIILTGNILIDHDHYEARGNMIIPGGSLFSGARFQGFETLAATAKAHGALLIGQVNHPGRQCLASIQPNPISASDVQLECKMMGEGFAKPHPASLEEIRSITEGFVHAAVFLDKAGFDGIQLHAAHGYLLAQFLSETTNLRTDEYGGCLANRARLITEMADEIRARTRPGFILAIKINSVEFQENGLTVDEAAELCEMLERHCFDFVELSGGTYEQMGIYHRRESTKAREAFFLEFAEKVAPHLKRTRGFLTGGFRSAGAMVNALKTVDGVGLGRPICTEPFVPSDILSGAVTGCIKPLGDDNDWAITASIAFVQIRLLGRGLRALDTSDQDDMDLFDAWMDRWAEAGEGKRGGDLFDHLPSDRVEKMRHSSGEVALRV